MQRVQLYWNVNLDKRLPFNTYVISLLMVHAIDENSLFAW